MTARNIDIATRGTSLHVTDVIEQRQCVLRTPTPATAESVDGDSFYFPVDAAAALNVQSVTLGNYVPTFVRNGDGNVVAEVDRFDEQTFDDGAFLLELEQPVKLYIRVHGSLRIETTGMTTTIETDGQLWVGARSRHNHPAATITTTMTMTTRIPERNWNGFLPQSKSRCIFTCLPAKTKTKPTMT
jgi:hypothetical protein